MACREGVLHFVEVKTRRSGSLTPPEAAVTQRKFRALSRAAACYLRTVGWEGEVQFDLAAAEAAADKHIFDLTVRKVDAKHRRALVLGGVRALVGCQQLHAAVFKRERDAALGFQKGVLRPRGLKLLV